MRTKTIPSLLSSRLLLLTGAATLSLMLLGLTRAAAQATLSAGATGANGSYGPTGSTGASNPGFGAGSPGGMEGTGGAGGAAVDLSGNYAITAGTYTGGTGGQGGQGGQGGSGFIYGTGGNGGMGGPGGSAVVARGGSTVSITGGSFVFGLGGAGGQGAFSPSDSGANGSAGASGYTLLNDGGTITLFGTFDGGARTLPTGTGSFTGTLANSTSAQTFTYNDLSGPITLANAVVPEPGTWAVVVLGAGLLGFVTSRQRRRA